jgi:hypothetical protein
VSVYLVGNSYTEPVSQAEKVTSADDIARKPFSYAHFHNTVVNIAVNGGPGSGKGSFEGIAVKELSKNPDNVVILVAESARDVLDELHAEGKLEGIQGHELSQLISQEQQRRREISEQLQSTFSDKNVYVIYDRDQANCAVYDCFFQHFNFDDETLDEEAFMDSFRKYEGIDGLAQEMREMFDISYILSPVRHEINYACSAPKLDGARVDETRKESFVMANQLHNALELGAKFVYGDALTVVPNTDLTEPGKAKMTIRKRAMGQMKNITTHMQDKVKSKYKPSCSIM